MSTWAGHPVLQISLTTGIRRIREKYEAELKEVERSERSTLEKFNAMKVGNTYSHLQ